MTTPKGILLASLLALAACKSGDKKSPTKPNQMEPSATIAASDAQEARPPTKAPDAPEPSLDVAPLSLATVGTPARTSARNSHRAARKLHQFKKYAEAIAAYKGTLEKNPGHIFARYNLASALVSAGQPKNAVRTLAALKLTDCSFCLGRLVRARKDDEWKSLWADADFVALTEDASVEQAPIAKITESFIAALNTGEMATVEKFVHPSRSLALTESLSLNGEEDEESIRKMAGVVSLKSWILNSGFVDRPVAHDSPIDQGVWNAGKIRKCDDECCTMEGTCEGRCGAGHDGVFTNLYRVCVAQDSGSAQYISAIEISAFD